MSKRAFSPAQLTDLYGLSKSQINRLRLIQILLIARAVVKALKSSHISFKT